MPINVVGQTAKDQLDMIEKTTAFKVGEQFFPCIEDAQASELAAILKPITTEAEAAKAILGRKEDVINILTMKPTSHPKARRANGATRKPRTPKATATTGAS